MERAGVVTRRVMNPMTNPERGETREPSAGGSGSAGPSRQVEERAPDRLSQMPRRSWKAVLRGTLKEFKDDELTDRAAALTYYGILAILPGSPGARERAGNRG